MGQPAAVAVSATCTPCGAPPEAEDEPGLILGVFDPKAWNLALEIGLASDTGDTKQRAATVGIDLGRSFREIWEHKLSVDMDYARQNSLTNKKKLLTDYQVFLRKWDGFYLFGFLRFDYDSFSGFDYQVAENVGAGYRVINSARQTWSVEGGPGMRHEKIENGSLDTQTSVLLTSNYEFRLNDGVSIKNGVKFFLGEDNHTVENTAELLSQLTRRLAAKISLKVTYDSEVPLGKANTNTATRASLLYRF